MNLLLRKETRMLGTAWCFAMVAATTPFWHSHKGDIPAISLTIFAGAMLWLALTPFGHEIQYGTFGFMLVQPGERSRLWNTKICVLGVAMLSVWLVFASCSIHFGIGLPLFGLLLTALAFSGGLWTTLLLRDLVSAFLCTCVAPMVILYVLLAVGAHWFVRQNNGLFMVMACVVLAVYAVTAYLWARRFFLRAEDVPWTGGQISWKTGRSIPARWLSFAFTRPQNRWLALTRKELQLQEVILFLAPILAILHLIAIAVVHFNPSLEAITEAVPVIWLATIPGLIGAAAVAEERRLNTWESLMCLPVSKLGSFTLKLVVVLVLGVVLGGIIPWVLWRGGNGDLGICAAVALIGAGGAFYASTMSRGLLQAIPLTIGSFTVLGFFLMPPISHGVSYDFVQDTMVGLPVNSALARLCEWPALGIALLWLAFRNYKCLQITVRTWLENLVAVSAVAAVSTLLAIAVFDRAWEFFEQLEPPHGAAVISGTVKPSMLLPGIPRMKGVSQDRNTGIRTARVESDMDILLPDGRLWAGVIEMTRTGKWDETTREWKEHPRLSVESISGGFVGESNWAQIAETSSGAIARTTNGSVNQISSQQKILPLALTWEEALNAWPLQKIHSNEKRPWTFKSTNYLGEVDLGYMMLAIQRNGTLWVVGQGNYPEEIFGEKLHGARSNFPAQVGTNTDWTSLSGNWPVAALRGNGMLWTFVWDQSKRPSVYNDWIAATDGLGGFTCALAKDGTLVCWNVYGMNEPGRAEPTFWQRLFLGPSRHALFSTNICGVAGNR